MKTITERITNEEAKAGCLKFLAQLPTTDAQEVVSELRNDINKGEPVQYVAPVEKKESKPE